VSAAGATDGVDRDLGRSLELYPHQIDLDRDRVLMLRLTPQDFSAASFLDQRLLDRSRSQSWISWDRIREALRAEAPGKAPHYLFHVGHCGSTLVSRLLDELGVMPLREPLPLRTFAELHAWLDSPGCRWPRPVFDQRLALLLRLFARGDAAKAVKASSFCNDLAPAIMAADPQTRATIVYATPRAYIANLLAGPNSRRDLEALTPLRLARLSARIGAPAAGPGRMSPGVAAALNWAAEMAALAQLAESVAGPRVLALDFDRFLGDLGRQLRALADHVVPGTTDAHIASLSSSPTLQRYSKAPEFAYDAALRRRVREEAELQWGAEIHAGLHWLRQAAGRHPAIGAAVLRFEGA